MVQASIFHVNGDDPEAAVWVGRLAVEYRQTFGVQGPEDEPADAESEGQGDARGAEFQWCLQESVVSQGMASTMPSHTNAAAAPMTCPVADFAHGPVGLVDGAGRGTAAPA
jgi:hypothetical protein